MTDMGVKKQAKDILNKINSTYMELSNNFYVCYSVPELADKIAYDILKIIRDDYLDFPILYKRYGDTHKIAIALDDNDGDDDPKKCIWLLFNIVYTTGMFGDSGLLIKNGKVHIGEIKGYDFIDDVFDRKGGIKDV